MKNGKAAGTDEIPAEALKVDPDMLVEMFYGLFEQILEKEILSEWKEGLLIKIPKKGELGLYSIYRGITLSPIHARESFEQSPLRNVERICRAQPPGPAIWLQARQVMYQSDHNNPNYRGTMNWTELPPLCKFFLSTTRKL